ncbi:MAG: hypothetical protein AAFY24_02030 [Pseudomonadota bacterium]
MKLPEPTGGGDFERTPPGTHLALCYRFIDLGTQTSTWNGQEKHQRKVMISWELPEELMKEGEYAGKPFTIHQRYTWSMSEKANLRKDLEAWRGRPFRDSDFGDHDDAFDIKNILGKACLLGLIEVEKGDKVYTNIASVSALPKGMNAPTEPVNPQVYFALTEGEFNNDDFGDLSENLQKTIASSPEYKTLTGEIAPQPSESVGHAHEHIPEDAYTDGPF